MFEAHTLDRAGLMPVLFFENMGRSERFRRVMSKCVVEAKAGPEGPNQVSVVSEVARVTAEAT